MARRGAAGKLGGGEVAGFESEGFAGGGAKRSSLRTRLLGESERRAVASSSLSIILAKRILETGVRRRLPICSV